MNMQTAPCKFRAAAFFFTAVWVAAACTSADGPSLRLEGSDAVPGASSPAAPQAFAKLIDREMAASQPHLRAHQGQIALGQNQLELITSSVPPLTGGSVFYPLFTRIYKASGKTWQQQTWQPQLEIAVSTSTGEFLPMIGQDIEHQNNQPHLMIYFRGSDPAQGQMRLDMEWMGESPLVKATLTQQGGSSPLRWQLRLGAGWGAEHLIPFDQDHFAGLTISLFPDVFSILSQTPLEIKNDKQKTLLSAALPNSSGRSSFLMLFGRNAALQQPALVDQMKQCAKKNEADCLRLANRISETWQVQLPIRQPMPRSEKRLFQSLFVHDAKGGFVSTLPIYEGEQLKWNLPTDPNWEVLYPDTQGILKKLSFDPDTRTATLPPLALGSLQVDLKPGRPGFVEIRDAIRRDGISWAPLLAHRPADVLTAHSFLQKSWPFAAHLPAGDYQLQIMDGMERICSQTFTILPGRNQTISCAGDAEAPELSLRANLSVDASSASDELLEASHFQAIGRLVRSGKDDDASPNEIPMIMVEDLNLGLSLRAFPADETLRKAWLAVKPKDNEALLPAFARFARDRDSPLQVVLECPDADFQLEEYRWLALTIQPDIIEVFGCQQSDLVDELLQVAHKLQQKSPKAIKLAAAAPFPARMPGMEFIPAIYVPIAAQNPVSLVTALRNGDYSLGLRSEIAVPGPLPTIGDLNPQPLTVRIRSYDLNERSALIRIYDQNELLIEQAMAPSRDHEQTLRINLRLRPGSRFLRVELLSQGRTADAHQEALTQPFLLATSNFLGLNGQP